MNKRPSERVNALIHTVKNQPTSYDEIIAHLEIMADNFQKDEAEAYRSVQSLIKYVGIKEAI